MVTKYKAQGDSILAFMETVKEDLASSLEDLNLTFFPPKTKLYGYFYVSFSKRKKVLYCRHGAGDNCYLTSDKNKTICGYCFDDEERFKDANEDLFDLMQVWGDVKRRINEILARKREADNFKA